MKELIIDGIVVSNDSDCYVTAEIGHNHQGNLDTCMEMFRIARECGAKAVKLQKRDNRALYVKALYNQPYDHRNSYGKTYGEHREFLEFGRSEYLELKRYAKELQVAFICTPFDFLSVDFLSEIDLSAYKIASGDLNNTPLQKRIAELGKPIFLSTGGGTIDDVQRAYDTIMPINSQLCIMQCTASYPCEPDEMNLRVIESYREKFPDVVVGLSDHQNGISMSLVAYTLGARVFEKHYTLNHTWKGTDHAFSLEPIGLKRMVRDLRRARMAMGDGVKSPYSSETAPLYKMGKKLVAAHDLEKGRELRIQDIAIKSPNDGLPPYELENIIGKILTRAIQTDENISFQDLSKPE